MIIPFENLESIPIDHSRDYNRQHCIYNTSDNNTTYPINELTVFPSLQDIVKAAYSSKECPQTEVIYSVFYGLLGNENAIIPLPNKAIKTSVNPEPYYNELTRDYDLFECFICFNDIQDAYDYSISHLK